MTASDRNDLQDEMALLLNTAVSDLRSSSIQDLEIAGRWGSGIASPSMARPGSRPEAVEATEPRRTSDPALASRRGSVPVTSGATGGHYLGK